MIQLHRIYYPKIGFEGVFRTKTKAKKVKVWKITLQRRRNLRCHILFGTVAKRTHSNSHIFSFALSFMSSSFDWKNSVTQELRCRSYCTCNVWKQRTRLPVAGGGLVSCNFSYQLPFFIWKEVDSPYGVKVKLLSNFWSRTVYLPDDGFLTLRRHTSYFFTKPDVPVHMRWPWFSVLALSR